MRMGSRYIDVDGVGEIALTIKRESDALGVSGIKGKVEVSLRCDPNCAKRPKRSLDSFPSEAVAKDRIYCGRMFLILGVFQTHRNGAHLPDFIAVLSDRAIRREFAPGFIIEVGLDRKTLQSGEEGSRLR